MTLNATDSQVQRQQVTPGRFYPKKRLKKLKLVCKILANSLSPQSGMNLTSKCVGSAQMKIDLPLGMASLFHWFTLRIPYGNTILELVLPRFLLSVGTLFFSVGA